MERISNVVRSSIAGSPSFDVFPLDPGQPAGFLVVAVPASMNAPHQVTIRGQHRFYGRGPGGNVILTQGEIDRLYLRRSRWVEEGSAFLDSAVNDTSGVFSESGERLGWLQVAIKPLIGPEDLLDRASPTRSADDLADLVRDAENALAFSTSWDPHVLDLARQRFYPTLNGVSFTDGANQFMEVRDDGEIRYAFAGIANDWNSHAGADRVWIIRDASVARVLCELFVFANRLYTRAGYHGPTNVGYLVSKSEGAVSASWFEGIRVRPPMGAPQLPADVRRIDQVLVADLAPDRVKDTVRRLIAPLIRVLASPGPHPLD